MASEQFDADVLPAQLKKLIDDESEHFSTRHIACMQGFDCSSPDPNERQLIEMSRPIVEQMGHEVVQSSLEDYMREMMKELKDPEVLTGESRNPGATGKWTALMGDVISSRIKIKRRNAQVETALQRRAEPFSLLGWLSGGEYMRSAIDRSWQYLLQNHPHDNICGAGVDQMEKDMHYRFDQAEIISDGVMRRGLAAIQKQIDNRDVDTYESVITVFNPCPWPRSEVVSLSIDLPDQCSYEGFSLRDVDGNTVSFVETDRRSHGTLVRNLQDISLQLRSDRVTMHLELSDVPAMGYATYLVRHEASDVGRLPLNRDGGDRSPLLENEFLKVVIQEDGSLDVTNKQTGHTFYGQHYFEDSGEAGHAWIHQAPTQDEVVTSRGSQATIELLESSDLLTRYRVSHALQIPENIEGEPENTRRTESKVTLPIVSTLTLRKGQRWLDVQTTIDNQAENHRVRACFPTQLAVEQSAAEATFDVITRPVVQPKDSNYYGQPNPQFPMHRFVDMSDGELGLGILNEGLREYEAVVDDDRTLAITLVRGFPAQQSPVIDQWDVYPWMKLAQSLGKNDCHYAIMPHGGDWQQGGLYREADRFVLPLETAQAGKGGGDMPKRASFVEVSGEGIELSAMKKCDERDSMILRLFNPTSSAISSQVTFCKPIQEAWRTNMNEERREQLAVDGNQVSVTFEHKQIITLEVILD